MDLRSGLRLNESTQRSWHRLVDANSGQTRVRLRQPFVMVCINGEKEVTTIIDVGTEVTLFCNMSGPYKQASTAVKRRTWGTFFVEEGGTQISVMSDWSIRVVKPQQPTASRTELERARHPQETLSVAARW